MRKFAALMLASLALNACATLNLGDSGMIYRHNQEKKLAAAVALQKEGRIPSAVESLKALCGSA
jgi:hypothetical protein